MIEERPSKEVIAKFCGPCDNLKTGGVCGIDPDYQARSIGRDRCDWAKVAGKRGQMTSQGFVPRRS